jgi:hypothetical protein
MDDATEHWEPIPDFPGYRVSDLGDVISTSRPLIRNGKTVRTLPEIPLKPSMTTNGFLQVVLSHDGHQKSFRVHDLVLKAFVGEKPKGQSAVFRNGDRTDCRLVNLRWGRPLQRSSVPLPPYFPTEATDEQIKAQLQAMEAV